MNRYLFLASLTYAYPILRPLQKAIRARGDEAAWFIDGPCEQYLRPDEKRLYTVREVLDYDPAAVFTPGNSVYDFFPGVKVQLFHGFNIDKRPGRGDHFSLKGLFDLYCTQGNNTTGEFQRLAEKHGYFKAVETGWTKIDALFDPDAPALAPNERPVILYASTFTKWITSTPYLYEEIEKLAATRPWDWLLTLHPKTDPETVKRYASLEEKYPNVRFRNNDNNVELLRRADVMVCDSSSIMEEFMMLDKPVVSFRNTVGGDHLIDIREPALLGDSIERALTRPPELMARIRRHMDDIHPYRDGRSSERVLAATDRFIAEYRGKLRRKPLNLVRKYQLRKRLHYWPLLEKIKGNHP